jgi:hypothetical protein
MDQEVSHIDVYPNGGDHQPDCLEDRLIKWITDGAVEGVKQLTSCNHQRAIDYFIESINNDKIPVAYQCKDWETFLKGQCAECGDKGDQCAKFGPGVEEWKKFRKTNTFVRMYLKTTGKSPYFCNYNKGKNLCLIFYSIIKIFFQYMNIKSKSN